MMHTLTTDPTHAADLDTVAQLLTPTGDRVSDPRLDRWADELEAAALRALYRDMAITRRLDGEGVALQRQGHLGLWAPAQGQEAIQVASAHACRPDDFLFPSYRELGVLVTRGASPAAGSGAWRRGRRQHPPGSASPAPSSTGPPAATAMTHYRERPRWRDHGSPLAPRVMPAIGSTPGIAAESPQARRDLRAARR